MTNYRPILHTALCAIAREFPRLPAFFLPQLARMYRVRMFPSRGLLPRADTRIRCIERYAFIETSPRRWAKTKGCEPRAFARKFNKAHAVPLGRVTASYFVCIRHWPPIYAIHLSNIATVRRQPCKSIRVCQLTDSGRSGVATEFYVKEIRGYLAGM